MSVYYNEFSPKAAAWLRELIKDGLIPDGEVDERSIIDVRADELRGFTQCHFFAGIGGWPLALSMAGIQENFRCWTGSCPCQPFSNAGKRKGIKDERDLWPVFFSLIKECRPQIVIGEQVASSEVVGSELEASFLVAVQKGDYARANKLAKRLAASKGFHYHQRWLDRVYADLETEGYTGRPEVLGANSVGAPHIRQRLYWGAARLAYSQGCGYLKREHRDETCQKPEDDRLRQEKGMRLSDSSNAGLDNRVAENSPSLRWRGRHNGDSTGEDGKIQAQGLGNDGGLHNSDIERFNRESVSDERRPEMPQVDGGDLSNLSPWSDFGLVLCRDGKVRRVPAESVLLGVADGVSENLDGVRYQSILEHPEKAFPLCTKEAVQGRAMLLKGYGNAIVPELAAEFIKAFLIELTERD